MKWKLPKENYFTEEPLYPFFGIFLSVLLVFVICATMELSGWPEGKEFNKEFCDGIITPAAIVSFIVMAIMFYITRLIRFTYHAASYLERKGLYDFHRWAIKSLPLLDCSMLLPVDHLSLKIQGIEGEAPISPATPLKIDIDEESVTDSRLNKVITKLLEPMGGFIGRSNTRFSLWIYVKDSDDSLHEDVRTALMNIKAPINALDSINVLTEAPGYDLINTWIDEGFLYQRLLINIELHTPEEDAFFENATAFLFDNNPHKEDSPVYLLRMMDSLANKVRETARIYFTAKQLDPSSLKKAFFCKLTKKDKSNLFTALEENNTGIEADKRYELEKVTGEATETQKWVTLALAAEAVQYAQGNQLVASAVEDKIYVGMLAEKYPGWWPEPYEFIAIGYAVVSTLIILIPTWFAIPVIFHKFGGRDFWGLTAIEVIVTGMIVFILGVLLHRFLMDSAESNMGIYHYYW